MRACFESHRLAWRSIRDGNEPNGLVMEDDIILSNKFPTTLDALAKLKDIDVIKIDGIAQNIRFEPIIESNGIQLRETRQTIGSTASYIISRESANKLENRAANSAIILLISFLCLSTIGSHFNWILQLQLK